MNRQRWLVGATIAWIGFAAVVPASADTIGVAWPTARPGDPVTITYSFSNLFDDTFLLIRPAEMRAATEEALRLWARYAPLHFVETPDSGPPPSDSAYPAGTHPEIRIGHHPMGDLAHAFMPDGTANGLNGDVHFDPGVPFTVGTGRWDFLETVTHELGHALGLPHETRELAIMNPSYPQRRFQGLGTAFLYPSDISAIRALYGTGLGHVQPLPASPVPEPASVLLVCTGLAGLAASRRSRRLRSHRH
jgi:hypothetical protein